MAGLAEVCTYIDSILFWLEYTVKRRESMTVTDKKAYWVAPYLHKTGNTQKRLTDINFTSPAAKKLRLNQSLSDCQANILSPISSSTKNRYKSPPRLRINLSNLYSDLNSLKQNPVLLSILPNYCELFSRTQTMKSYPKVLAELYDEKYKGLSYANLLLKCNEISFTANFSEELAKLIFNETLKQSNCQKWYDFRSGRVTASVSGKVCNSRDEMPPVSLIKKICYGSKFRSVATDWGHENENDACHKYCEYMSKPHANHSVNLSGLILNADYPYLGASPDSIVNCSCCGVGCLEMKCPSKYRDNLIEDMIFGSCGYLEFDNGGAVEIIKTHAYYYQIQTQLLATQYDYCDFFVMLIIELKNY